MSLDNVLAVAGAAHEHPWVMAAGLVLSIGMMAVAANLITGLLKRWPWLWFVSYRGGFPPDNVAQIPPKPLSIQHNDQKGSAT